MKSYRASEVPQGGAVYLKMNDVLEWIKEYDEWDTLASGAVAGALLQDILNDLDEVTPYYHEDTQK